ncbi:MAG: PaaI family thioesterase [Gammaproteobacteria bacterium]|nr:PaaI family thioesterase [Gammaproteobacteria bacterium]
MQKDILSQLLGLIPKDSGMELPPKVFLDMGGTFIGYEEGKSLTARFPNKNKYMNPFRLMQGGIITAAIDNTISPLSYIVAPPSITKEIRTTYKRPVKESDVFIDVVATLVEKSLSEIILKAEVLNEKGKLVATAVAKAAILRNVRKQLV